MTSITSTSGGSTTVTSGGALWVHDGQGSGVNVILSGQAASTASLNLQNGSVGSIAVSPPQGSTFSPSYGALNVTGHGAATGGISLGGFHQASASLNIALSPQATFTSAATTSVLNGSTLSETGGVGASFANNGSIVTSGASKLSFMTAVSGTGAITDSTAATGGGSKIEFGGAVAKEQSIALNAGSLQLDQPMLFHGTVAHLNTSAAPAYGPTYGVNNGAILLMHTHVDNVVASATELVLKHGAATVADLNFAGLAHDGSASLFLTNQADGSTVVSGYSLRGSVAVYMPALPTSQAI